MIVLDRRVAVFSGFTRGAGKRGRFLRRELDAATWERFEATHADARPASGWAALEAVMALFRSAATEVAERCGLAYPFADDRRVSALLRRMRARAGGDEIDGRRSCYPDMLDPSGALTRDSSAGRSGVERSVARRW
jgi:hypothetical protein